MDRSIWKYPMGLVTMGKVIRMPKGAQIVSVAVQDGTAHIWALVNTEAPLVDRWFAVRGTGWEVEEELTYIDTWHQDGYVWHLFERM